MKKTVLLSHGSGGRMMDDLIHNMFFKHFKTGEVHMNSDSAILNSMNQYLIAFTTDSYVIDPIFFPGGNIGKLAVCGTINDLAVSGAEPLYISCSFIIEEGFSMELLEEIVLSMAKEAGDAGVAIVTGDTKVVNKGKCDKIFINTSGIGKLKENHKSISTGNNIKPGDKIIINGFIGDHAIAILGARENIQFETPVYSDCAALHKLVRTLLDSNINIKFMRDITRGGLSTILSEIVENREFGIEISEKGIPIHENVKGTCELFGFDPLYLANEGKILFIINAGDSEKALKLMQKHSLGKDSVIIGEINNKNAGKALLQTTIGGRRLLDKLPGEQLPRIC